LVNFVLNHYNMRIRLFNVLLILSLAGAAFFSCKRDTNQILRDQEVDYIKKYIQSHPDLKLTTTGIYYQQLVAGDAATDSIKTGDMVKVFYSGYLLQDTVGIGIKTGSMFDSSGDYEPFSFTVGAGGVIAGWEEGIRLMKDGGEALWLIPSRFAYASQPQSRIPAYSPLLFHIKIYKVYRSTDVFPIIQKLSPGSPSYKQ
jgi:FKBP-type peptidyl-prolyl cis-trans isomerase